MRSSRNSLFSNRLKFSIVSLKPFQLWAAERSPDCCRPGQIFERCLEPSQRPMESLPVRSSELLGNIGLLASPVQLRLPRNPRAPCYSSRSRSPRSGAQLNLVSSPRLQGTLLLMSQQDELQKREQEWDKLQALGLHPEIRSLEIYVTEVALGMQIAIETLLDHPVRLPNLETIRTVHFQMFGRVHPWAGEFRSSGQHVNVGTHFRGADPKQIVYELELVRRQTEKLFETGNHLEAVAFFHLRFERIHPFLDGNGRVGRALLQSQLAADFGFRTSLVFKKSEYTAALNAGERNLLGPLMQLIARAAALSFDPGLYQSLYRISPDPDYVQGKGVDAGLQESRRQYIRDRRIHS